MLLLATRNNESMPTVTASFNSLLRRRIAGIVEESSTNQNGNEKKRELMQSFKSDSRKTVKTMLNTTLCTDRCISNCVSYITPTKTCYNGQQLFPNDPSWGPFDILDDDNDGDSTTSDPDVEMKERRGDGDSSSSQFRRTFFTTKDGTCHQKPGEPSDVYILPLDECVGPFDAPRPWGTFAYVNGDDDGVSPNGPVHGSTEVFGLKKTERARVSFWM